MRFCLGVVPKNSWVTHIPLNLVLVHSPVNFLINFSPNILSRYLTVLKLKLKLNNWHWKSMVPRILKCSSPYEKITLTKRFYGEPKMVLLRHYEKPFPTKVQWKGSMMELKCS